MPCQMCPPRQAKIDSLTEELRHAMDEVSGLRLAAESAKENLVTQAKLYEQLDRDFREARSRLEESSSLRQACDREL